MLITLAIKKSKFVKQMLDTLWCYTEVVFPSDNKYEHASLLTSKVVTNDSPKNILLPLLSLQPPVKINRINEWINQRCVQFVKLSGTRKATGLYLVVFSVLPIASQTLLALRSRKIVSKNTGPVVRPPIRMTPPLGSSTRAAPLTKIGRGGPYLQTWDPSSKNSDDVANAEDPPTVTIVILLDLTITVKHWRHKLLSHANYL